MSFNTAKTAKLVNPLIPESICGSLTIDNVCKECNTKLGDEIDSKSNTASDFWIEYDRPKYDNDDIFKTLIEDIKNIDVKEYKKIMNTNI